jgi:5-formyltetrahydrofolate cyclo-ligase
MQKFQDKSLFREYCKKRVKYFAKVSRYKRDKAVANKLLYLIKMTKAKDILLYVPLASEVNILYLLKTLRGKKNIFVPFMEGVSFKMVKFRLPLFKKNFNIKEPKNSLRKISKLDLAIVPVLGVDGTLKRVGFGKGMYDRFFDSLQSLPYVVFVQLGECITYEKVCDDFDIQANLYITPKKNIVQRGKNDNRNKYSSRSRYHKWHSRLLNSKKIRCCKL